jgi:hypothetical protein
MAHSELASLLGKLAEGKQLDGAERIRLEFLAGRIEHTATVAASWIPPAGGFTQFDHIEVGTGRFEILPLEGAILRSDTAQSVEHDTDSPLTFDEADSFSAAHGLKYSPATSPTKVILSGIPGKSVYTIHVLIYWAANATGVRRIGVRVDGGTWGALQQVNAATGGHQTILSAIYTHPQTAANQELEFQGFQTSGSALDVTTAHVAVFRLR